MIIFLLAISSITAIISLIIEGDMTIVFYSYGIVVPLLILVPNLVYRFHKATSNILGRKGIWFINLFMLTILLVNIPGSLYFHSAGIQYDRIIHFSAGLLIFLLVVMLRVLLLSKSKRLRAKTQILTTSFIGVFVALFVWEGYQYSIDQIFGSKLFFDAAQSIYVDVTEDILYGLGGMIIALVYTVVSYKKILKKFE